MVFFNKIFETLINGGDSACPPRTAPALSEEGVLPFQEYFFVVVEKLA
jgi:hypothetical protein